MTNAERAALLILFERWRQLADDAKQRGDERRDGDIHPAYFYGVQYGLQHAADELLVVLGAIGSDVVQ